MYRGGEVISIRSLLSRPRSEDMSVVSDVMLITSWGMLF